MSGARYVEAVRAVDVADQLPGLQRAVDLVMIVIKSPRTTRHATGTDGTDHDLRPLNQQGPVLMLTR
jgi:hypothetical protein